jgi:hypothetical protein
MVKTRAVEAAASWRDGVHITGSSIWCDARRRRDVCFVSAADRVTIRGHGQLIASPTTMALLGSSGDGDLSVPVRKPFTLGKTKIELFPSGAGLGATGLRIDLGHRTVVYAAAIQPNDAGLATLEAAEVRRCDALVIDAPFGDKHQRLVNPVKAVEQLHSWIAKQTNNGRTAVILVDNWMRGLDIVRALQASAKRDSWQVTAHRSIRSMAQRAATLHPGLLIPTLAAATRGNVIVWPIGFRDAIKPIVANRIAGVMWVSGDAWDKSAVARLGVDAGLAWAHAADRDSLLEWIATSKAKTVYLTGRCAATIAAAIGPHASILAPPQQISMSF